MKRVKNKKKKRVKRANMTLKRVSKRMLIVMNYISSFQFRERFFPFPFNLFLFGIVVVDCEKCLTLQKGIKKRGRETYG